MQYLSRVVTEEENKDQSKMNLFKILQYKKESRVEGSHLLQT